MKIAEAMAVGALKDAYLHDRKIKRRLLMLYDTILNWWRDEDCGGWRRHWTRARETEAP
jgi:hypothetical protein